MWGGEVGLAYSASDTRVAHPANRETYLVFVVTETEMAAASEYSIGPLPEVGTISLFKAELTSNGSGTATTIQPRIGNAATWTADNIEEVDYAATAAANHNIQTPTRYYAPDGYLYVRSTPDSGTDGEATTYIVIRPGHHG